MSKELIPYNDLEGMAAQVVQSGMFPGIKTPQQAMTLFLVAQAEGLHPMTATMRYNIIQGRPAMKSEAMLASFMERGGTVDWTEYTNDAVSGVFKSAGVPNGVTVRWTLEDARRAGITNNPTWQKYPRQMLKARVASDGVRMADPAVNQGRYTPEEHESFDDEPQTVAADAEIVDEPGGTPGDMRVGKGFVEAWRAGEAQKDDLTERLTASIAAAEAKKNAALDARCPECASVTEIYASTQKGANAGRKFRQCKFAHDAIISDMAEGVEQKLAYAAQSKHLREWVEGPRKVSAHGAAPKEADVTGPTPQPEEPAPSIFETLDQISEEARTKWAR